MMPAPSGRPDFFALEAGEYLRELGRALDRDVAPDAGLLRVARALRGASLLAGPADFTRAAAALEAAWRAAVDGHTTWGPAPAELLRGAVETLHALLRRVHDWHPDDATRALRLADELERHTREAGAPPPPPFGRRASDRSQPGVRAFLAREAAVVAGAVERLAREPGGVENPAAIENVLRTTRPLRGVAFLGEVPPLGELLDLIESLARDPLTGHPCAPSLPEALSALAGALAQAAREITGGDGPATDTAGLLAAAQAARAAALDESDVVSIEALFAAGDPAPIVEAGSPPAPPTPGPDDALPMLALAGRLNQAADQFGLEAPAALRHLQETVLLLTLRSGLPSRPVLPVDRLLAAVVRALGRGAAAAEREGFVRGLRQAAAAVAAVAEATPPQGAPSIALVTGLFETLPAEPSAPAPVAVATDTAADADEPEPPVVDIDTLLWREPIGPADSPPRAIPVPVDTAAAPAEGAIVPIEALAPEPAPGAAAPPPSLDRFEASLQTYRRLLLGGAAALVATPPEPPPAEPVVAAAPAGARGTGPDVDVVPIETLLFRGRAALVRANEVRQEIDAIVAAFRAERRLEPLIQELLDLVPLALDDRA